MSLEGKVHSVDLCYYTPHTEFLINAKHWRRLSSKYKSLVSVFPFTLFIRTMHIDSMSSSSYYELMTHWFSNNLQEFVKRSHWGPVFSFLFWRVCIHVSEGWGWGATKTWVGVEYGFMMWVRKPFHCLVNKSRKWEPSLEYETLLIQESTLSDSLFLTLKVIWTYAYINIGPLDFAWFAILFNEKNILNPESFLLGYSIGKNVGLN